jgi:hypothetical protein
MERALDLEGRCEAQAEDDQIDRECYLHSTFLHLMREVDAIAHCREAERRQQCFKYAR